MQINQLTAITDVTERVAAATKGAEGEAFAKARQAVFATIERECATGDDVRCEVVTLYRGGKYDLYKYRRFSDVRLVFAPEFDTAFFGGDPDNFMFPRYNLDLAFMRLYDGRRSARSAASVRLVARRRVGRRHGVRDGTSRDDAAAVHGGAARIRA